MSNSVIMWLMALMPWATLVFMKKKDIKRYMPVAFFSIVTTLIIADIGTTLGFWLFLEPYFPFANIAPYHLGTMPALTMWVFKFTEGHFWRYMLTNTILDIGFNFLILGYFFPMRGIIEFNILPLFSLPITLTHAAVLYYYQMWQNDVLFNTSNSLVQLQPAVAKPVSDKPNDESDDK